MAEAVVRAIQLLHPSVGDLIVITFSGDGGSLRDDYHTIAAQLQPYGVAGVVFLPASWTITALSEGDLNNAGWFRQ